MDSRKFTIDGRHWRVFEVLPFSGFPVHSPLRYGWLCFESGDEHRRLAPIPSGWDREPVEQLIRLWEASTTVRPQGGSS